VVEALTAVEPGKVQNLVQTTDVRYKEKIVVSWDPLTDNGSSVLSSYYIGVYDDDNSVENYYTVSTYATSYSFDSLTPGSLY
jgi:hypothetical protein